MIRRLFLITAILLLLALPAYADLQSQSWKYYKYVNPKNDGFALIHLDPEVLTHSQDNLTDVRLSSGEGQEVPYQLVRLELYQEETYPAQMINTVIRVNEFSSITLDLQNENRLHNLILLDIESNEDYLRDVRIEGSEDNQTWNLIATKKVFYVSPHYRENNLSYPTASFRYIKVSIDSKGKEPLTVRGAKVKYVRPAGDRPESVLPISLTTEGTDPKTNKTEMLLDLGTKGYQVSHIDLEVNGSNFNRLIEYYDSNDGSNWLQIGTDRIYRYKWSDYEALRNRLDINRNHCGRYIKLIIDNQDSPPLDVKSVTVWGDSPKILADLRVASYTLWYGNPDSKTPQYDLSQFSHLIDKSKLPVLQPGPENTNANYHPKLTENRWLLNGITIVAALVIGLIILKNMKKTNA